MYQLHHSKNDINLSMTNSTFDVFKETLIKAYYYISSADGSVDTKEIEMGNKMIRKESIDKDAFQKKIESYNAETPEGIIRSLTDDLRKLKREQQIRIIAYMSNVANADGFMDPKEWKMIYNLYKNELNLPLEEIIMVQKTIPPFTN